MPNAERVKGIRDKLSRHRVYRVGIVKKKALLLLLGGLSLGMSGSPRTSWRIIGALTREWQELGRNAAERAVNSLYSSKLVAVTEQPDGTLTLVLSEKGRKKALSYDVARMKIKAPSEWDKLWRIVSFDVPEDEKPARDALRDHLFQLGFYELHKSVFIHPFECLDEVKFVAGLHDAGKYIRFILAIHVDNEEKLKSYFHLHAP